MMVIWLRLLLYVIGVVYFASFVTGEGKSPFLIFNHEQFGHYEIPVRYYNTQNHLHLIKFLFHIQETKPSLYPRILEFCEKVNFTKKKCLQFFNLVTEKHHEMRQKHLFFYKTKPKMDDTKTLYNQHLSRQRSALEAEVSNVKNALEGTQVATMLSREHATKDILKRYFFSPFSISSSSSHIPTPHTIYVVIHSCLLPSNPSDTRILSQLLDHVLVMVQSHQSGALMDRRYRRATDNTKRGEGDGRRSKVKVLVLHYGVSLPDEFMESYSQLYENGQNHTSTNPDANHVQDDNQASYPMHWNCKQNTSSCEHDTLHFVHVSDDTGFFEIPTMRLISYLSREDAEIRQHQHLQHGTNLKGNHILYLHTKGVSYAELYQQIEDWREYMLYFLVDEHAKMYRVLLSGHYDACGVNHERPKMFSGNFWYSTAPFVSQLPILEYGRHDKYAAEFWLFTNFHMRIYVPFYSDKKHAEVRYPPYCYRYDSNHSLPDYTAWSSICDPISFTHYKMMHKLQENQVVNIYDPAISKKSNCKGGYY